MRRTALVCVILAFITVSAVAQDRLPTMPGYDRYERMRREMSGSVRRGSPPITWDADGKGFTYSWDSKRLRFDVATLRATETTGGADPEPKPKSPQQPARGRQVAEARSPNGVWMARHRDRNVYLSPVSRSELEIKVTLDGSEKARTKNGVASWVYGEELNVREAMWWSPDSELLAFYHFDESKVLDYYLTLNLTKVQNTLDVEPYPKAGAENPLARLRVYEVATKRTVTLDTGFDSGGGPDLDHYIYDVRWSPEGDEILFNRTNRKQNVMEFCAGDPRTGRCRTIVREEWPASWTENHPQVLWLSPKEGQRRRFLWLSERSGFRGIYQGDLSGATLETVVEHPFEVARIVQVIEAQGTVWYLARSGDNPYKLQLHRARLDGSGSVRLTDPAYHHSVSISPTGTHFVEVIERLDHAPETRLCDAEGKVLASIVKSDLAKFQQLNLQMTERFTFLADDGKTTLYGEIAKPSFFDPTKKYPILVNTYAGPDSGGSPETFQLPPAITEMGFLVVQIEGRGTSGRGKSFRDAVYGKLGIVEVDDQAAGVRSLARFPWADTSRVGIYGTSYGGYASAMAILRHPDVFHVAVASSSVTQWANYDTIYTERYMGLPWEGENKEGYENGSCMKYVRNLKGRLLLFYGTADNNVHPANTHQLAQALMRAGKSFDMMVGPDQGHAQLNTNRMWEYFVEHLILAPAREVSKDPLRLAWSRRDRALRSLRSRQ